MTPEHTMLGSYSYTADELGRLYRIPTNLISSPEPEPDPLDEILEAAGVIRPSDKATPIAHRATHKVIR